jgi:hypothetical protein
MTIKPALLAEGMLCAATGSKPRFVASWHPKSCSGGAAEAELAAAQPLPGKTFKVLSPSTTLLVSILNRGVGL